MHKLIFQTSCTWIWYSKSNLKTWNTFLTSADVISGVNITPKRPVWTRSTNQFLQPWSQSVRAPQAAAAGVVPGSPLQLPLTLVESVY